MAKDGQAHTNVLSWMVTIFSDQNQHVGGQNVHIPSCEHEWSDASRELSYFIDRCCVDFSSLSPMEEIVVLIEIEHKAESFVDCKLNYTSTQCAVEKSLLMSGSC